MKEIDVEAQIQELEQMAQRIQRNISHFKRPFVIEFSGTPKSGKTSCIDAISKFLRRHRIETHVVAERASVCPIENKEHFDFNIWTGCTSLVQLLEALERPRGFVLLDRGIFDSLVWIDFHCRNQKLTKAERKVVEGFFLLERYRKRVQVVASLSVEPQEALNREFKDQLTTKEGTIMNLGTLKRYNKSLSSCERRLRDQFPKMLRLDTTKTKPVQGVARVARGLLEIADQLLDEQIAVVPQSALGMLQRDEAVSVVAKDTARMALSSILPKVEWIRRSEAEEREDLVQLIPAAVFLADKEILVFHIIGEKQGSLKEKESVWVGGHVRKDEDLGRLLGALGVGDLKSTLKREIEEELSRHAIDRASFPDGPAILVWDRSSERSRKHLGILFECHQEQEEVWELLDNRPHYESDEKSLVSRVERIDRALAEIGQMESWSRAYLEHAHGIRFTSGSDLDWSE